MFYFTRKQNQMPKPKRYRLTSQKFFSPKELEHIAELLEGESVSERDKIYLRTLMETGARASEILGLNAKSFLGDAIYIEGLKGSDSREVPISKSLYQELKKLSEKDASGKGRPFPVTYQWVKKMWREVRPSSKGLHAFRHTFAVQLYRRTKDLKLIKTVLGHSSILNTMIYADFEYTKSEMRRLILTK